MSELKPGDYVRLDDQQRVVRCEPTDFAYGTVVGMSEFEVGVAIIARLGLDSRSPHHTVVHEVAPVITDLSTPELVEEWLAT